MNEIAVSQRAQQILKILIERYIQDGAPVGSKTIAAEGSLGLSSASIRHILADLEAQGLLVSPHTSAGRVPTEQGYRLFVNNLLTVKPLEGKAIKELRNKLDPDLTTSNLVQSASSLLSGITHLIGVVTLPRHNRVKLRQVEFLPLSGNRVLVVLVLNNREVQNRIIYTDQTYSQSALQQAANYLNQHFCGKDLLTTRQELLTAMQNDRDNMAQLLQTAIDVASKAFSPEESVAPDCAIAGQNHLFNYSKEASPERLRIIFEAFTQKQVILNLLDHSLKAEGVQIFIGKESGYAAFDDFSIVTRSYSIDGELVGSLGVIGPTRMPYERIISVVDVTAKLLSVALNQN